MKANIFASTLLAFSISANPVSASDLTQVAKLNPNILTVTQSLSQNTMMQNRGVNNAILEASQCSSTKTSASLKEEIAKGIASKAFQRVALDGASAGIASTLITFVSAQRGLRKDLINTAIKLHAEDSPYGKVFMTSGTENNKKPKLYFAIFSPTDKKPDNIIVLSNGVKNRDTVSSIKEQMLESIGNTSPDNAMKRVLSRTCD